MTAALINVTVDDQGTDPRTGAAIAYMPTDNNWNIVQDCVACATNPNPVEAMHGTWHDATYSGAVVGQEEPDAATFEFTGALVAL